MKKNTTFTKLTQILLTEEEVKQLSELIGYEEKGRKLTVYTLLQYWIHAALEKWEGFRDGADRAFKSGLLPINYSTFSKKASEVPYEIFKRLFHLLVSKCNRATRRKLNIPSDLLLIDSTTITVGKNRLPWAEYHGKRAGIKLHVALDAQTEIPVQVVESIATKHDGPMGEQLANQEYTLVQDRAYGKIERCDRYLEEGQFFVIRLKENVKLTEQHSLCQIWAKDSLIMQDITCHLGGDSCRSKQRHRVVFFKDEEGNQFRVITNLMSHSAEQIADIYKARWGVEVFFRWIKQHLNVKKLFGTTCNAVYGQLYVSLITYVLLKWLHKQVNPSVLRFSQLSFARFTRLLSLDHLSVEWMLKIREILVNCLLTHPPNIPKNS
jgi:hypothetical protein